MNPQYTSYSAAALAADDAFIGWVLHGRDDAAWTQWLAGHPEISQRVDTARGIVMGLHGYTDYRPDPQALDSLWARIETSAARTDHPAAVVRPAWIRLWPVAAAAAIALLIWFALPVGTQQAVAGAGERQEFQLPEESQVVLNAGSRMAFAKKTFDRERMVTLEGEAFFAVKPGSTFTVETPYGSVTVLGTSFNVYARDGRLDVKCFTGKVRVTGHSGEAAVITPGQQVSAQADKLLQDEFLPDGDRPLWTAGRFRFNNRPLREVIAEYERQFDVRVEYPSAIGDLAYTGLFELGDPDTALQLITWPLHITYTRDGRTIRLSQ